MEQHATEPLTLITEAALRGSVIGILLFMAVLATIAFGLGLRFYLKWDKDKKSFHKSKKKDGVPIHVVQTESTTELAAAVRLLSSSLGGIRETLDKQGSSIANLATATNGLNSLQESWGAQMMEREDKAHDIRQSIRMGQRDTDDALRELNRRVGKLACSKANGKDPVVESP